MSRCSNKHVGIKSHVCIYAGPGMGKTTFINKENLKGFIYDTDDVESWSPSDSIITNKHDLLQYADIPIGILVPRRTWEERARTKVGSRLKRSWYNDVLESLKKSGALIITTEGFVSDVLVTSDD